MSIFLCQDNGDFAIVNNGMSLTDGIQEVLQLVRNNLKFFLGEEDLDPTLGTPWIQQIFQKGTPLSVASSILYQVVSQTPGVLSVPSFNLTLNPNTRQATLTFSITGTTGTVTTTEVYP